MDTTTYQELFAQRKWKKGLDAIPLIKPVVITLQSANDLQILRVRSSEFNKASGTKRVSISGDCEARQAIITVTKK